MSSKKPSESFAMKETMQKDGTVIRAGLRVPPCRCQSLVLPAKKEL